MKKIIIVTILSLFSIQLFGQSNFQQFKALFKKNDTAAIKTLLAKWEKTNPNDPEFYTSAFNFYFAGSKKEVVSIQKNPPKGEALTLNDDKGKTVAFLGSDIDYDPVKLARGFKCINTGIEKFPDRLDMRFGKCYALQEISDYDNFTKEVIKTVDYSAVNKNNWLWTENKKKEDGKAYFLSSIQGYLAELYNTNDDDLLVNIRQIGEATLKYYPDQVEILSTTAIPYLLNKDYDKALVYLKRAEKLDPKDPIVMNNIAECYKKKGDKANAIRYYELMEKNGDVEAKQQAKENLKKLKK